MRTTITLEPDVARRAKAATTRLKRPFKQVINEALRAGFDELERAPRRKPFRTKPKAMRMRPGVNLDNIAELFAQAEGEDYK
jgi:hypothetical protein